MPYAFYGCPVCEEPDDLQQYNEGDKCEDCDREVVFWCPDWLRPLFEKPKEEKEK